MYYMGNLPYDTDQNSPLKENLFYKNDCIFDLHSTNKYVDQVIEHALKSISKGTNKILVVSLFFNQS